MSCLSTLLVNAEERMEQSYKVVIEAIEQAMYDGKSELIFNSTNSHNQVSDTHLHMLTANALITNGFKVVRGAGTYIVSGWDRVKITA